jgi:dienelactone hydrolase
VLVSRLRARRRGEAAEVSALPPAGSSTFYGPLRYRRMVLRDAAPSAVARVAPYTTPAPAAGLAHELAQLDSHVWSAPERRRRNVTHMVDAQQQRRAEEAIQSEHDAWEKVHTRADWERFRDERLQGLKESVGELPPERPPLDLRVSARHTGQGYRLENLAFQSRPGYYMTANLYVPAKPAPRMPGIIIVHSQHYPKTQGELHDMGQLWARTGAAVLVMERPGYGERAETSAWFRQAYGSRFNFTKQLFLAGESYSGWAAWDVIRCVDMLYARPDIDRERIILLGSVAGGGEPAGVAAALDNRISAVAPFNYDQGHIRVHGDSPGQIAKQFSPWLVAASVAPRRFIRAFEFGWEGAEEHDFPTLWVDGMERSRKVWDFYGARENLAGIQGYGLIRLSNERASHCFSIGPQQRVELYPLLQRWFDIPFPSQADLDILPDSQVSVSDIREEARRQESQRRRPHADLLSITPELSAQLKRRGLHQLAHDIALRHLRAARERLRPLDPPARRAALRKQLQPLLGDITPAPPRATSYWTRALPGAHVEAVALSVEEGIDVPLLLLKPQTRAPAPVVVAIAQGGKERFLARRAPDLQRILEAGFAVCLPDLRAIGETSPSEDRNRDGGAHHGLAEMEFDLASNLLGARLKDLRSVLAYLRTRDDLDRAAAIWGDSFAPANPRDLYLDEMEFEVSPVVQHRAEPGGAILALLAALYEDDVRLVAANGGLSAWLSVLENPVTYAPMDAIVLGVLKVADIEDVAGALAPRPVLYEGTVDGRNVTVRPPAQDLPGWIVAQFRR